MRRLIALCFAFASFAVTAQNDPETEAAYNAAAAAAVRPGDDALTCAQLQTEFIAIATSPNMQAYATKNAAQLAGATVPAAAAAPAEGKKRGGFFKNVAQAVRPGAAAAGASAGRGAAGAAAQAGAAGVLGGGGLSGIAGAIATDIVTKAVTNAAISQMAGMSGLAGMASTAAIAGLGMQGAAMTTAASQLATGQLAQVSTIMPEVTRSARIYELAEAKSCDFIKAQ